MHSYFCPACKTKSLMANGTLKNNNGESRRMCVSVHPDVRAADLGHVSTVSSISHPPPPAPSSNHFCNSDLTLWAVQSMLLIKRKLVFIFKLHHQSRLISRPSLGSSYNDFMLKLLFCETIKAIYSECNGHSTLLFQMLPRRE